MYLARQDDIDKNALSPTPPLVFVLYIAAASIYARFRENQEENVAIRVSPPLHLRLPLNLRNAMSQNCEAIVPCKISCQCESRVSA